MQQFLKFVSLHLYRVSRGECARLRESVPYVKVHRYNPKHLYLKLNVYGDNGQRKVWSFYGSTYCICFAWLVGYGYGYIGARNDTTWQSEQTTDKELELKNITVMSAATLKPIRLECYLSRLSPTAHRRPPWSCPLPSETYLRSVQTLNHGLILQNPFTPHSHKLR
jgi:hypothetical protein